MHRIYINIILLFLAVALGANSISYLSSGEQNSVPARQNRTEVVTYQENFETGATGWTHYSGTAATNNWHIYNDGIAQGDVWWMGDPALASGANIGGYYNHQYLVLDTPQILVPTANPTLTFKIKYNVEALGTSGDYNGWDTCNIRLSTNNGQNWTVISGTPAYNMTSSYAFGYEHGEGVGIAGWGGNSNSWVNASFNLSNYAGMNVKIRFAFASDPEVATVNDLTLFGVMVDDIVLGSYSNNGVNDGQMTWSNLVPITEDLWHVATVADAPSPTHAMICQNASGTYNPNMRNYLISPPITLPSSGGIRADFMFKANMVDSNSFPDNDYFGWEISINNGLSWYFMSNPYGITPGNNYVYPPPTPTTSWYDMTVHFTLDGHIDNYAGQTVLFRWYLKSDNDTPSGAGFMIDNFKIYNDIYLGEPENLTAVATGTSVILNWIAPGGGGRTDSRLNREITAYNVFRDNVNIFTVMPSVLTCTDTGVSEGAHAYKVTAMYGINESLPSNIASVFVMPPNFAELGYDDGTSEQGYLVGTNNFMGVKYQHNASVTLKYMKVYISAIGTNSMYLRVYDDTGANGQPAAQYITQITYPVSSMIVGWNYIPFPPSSPITIADGSFYLALFEPINTSTIGFDTSHNGHSYKKVTASWESITEGEIMLRCIVQTNSPVQITQTVPLNSGWNLASFNVAPADSSLSAVCTGIAGALQQIKSPEGVYIPGNPFNTLEYFTRGKAFSVQVSSNTNWPNYGIPIPLTTLVTCNTGWNLIAYLPQTSQPVTGAMQSVSTWLLQLKGTDGAYIPNNPFSTLTNMYPGKGYWLKISGTHNLIYPPGAKQFDDTCPNRSDENGFESNLTKLPDSQVILVQIPSAKEGQVLTAWAGDELRGYQELKSVNKTIGALIQVYTDTSGECITFRLQDKMERFISDLTPSIISEPNSTIGNYSAGEYLMLSSGTTSEDNMSEPGISNISVFPNPFNPNTNINFSIKGADAKVNATIYNIKGESIFTLTNKTYPIGDYSLRWDGNDINGCPAASGIYFLRLKVNKQTHMQKLILLK